MTDPRSVSLPSVRLQCCRFSCGAVSPHHGITASDSVSLLYRIILISDHITTVMLNEWDALQDCNVASFDSDGPSADVGNSTTSKYSSLIYKDGKSLRAIKVPVRALCCRHAADRLLLPC